MNSYSVRGVVLSSKGMFEKDKIVTLYSPDRGKIRLLAKGAQGKSRLRGYFDPGYVVDCQVAKGKSFHIVTQCALVCSYSHIRLDYDRIAMTFYVLQIISESAAWDCPNSALYDVLIDTLSSIDRGDDMETLRRQFYCKFLDIEGLNGGATKVSDLQFIRLFEQYAGVTLRLPVLAGLDSDKDLF